MTKRWSSTRSLDGQTKRQASKTIRREQHRILEEHSEDTLPLADAPPAPTTKQPQGSDHPAEEPIA